jgi:phage-related protein
MVHLPVPRELPPRKISVVFYSTPSGSEVVLDWLRGLDSVDRQIIGQDLMRVQYRWPVGMPLCRPLVGGLWEVRCPLPGGRTARLIFCQSNSCLLMLCGFIKKTQKTPETELALAKRRMREFTG